METLHQQIRAVGDIPDLTTPLAATNWNKSASTLSNYLTVTNSAQGGTLSISAISGGEQPTGARNDLIRLLTRKRRRGNRGGVTMDRVGFSAEHNP